MRSNNALPRTYGYRGHHVLALKCVVVGSEWARCLAAELGR